jgi:hypothetical protein
MAQTWTIVVTTDESNASIHSELSPAATFQAGNASAPAWLRTVASWLDAAAVGSKNVSVAYTDSVGTETVKLGMP